MKANNLPQKLAAPVAWLFLILLLSSFSSLSVAQPVIAYPDLQVLTPTSLMSIGKPTSSTREFRFSHITWNAGSGPLEIRPNYNPSTNQSQGYQRLYTRNASGGLTFVMDVPIAVPMYWMPPTDYRFPMSGFGLYTDVNGALGTLVAASPKVNFCMTADVAVNLKLAFAPTSTAYSPSNCGDPNGILGLSIGWGDQYDYTDPGENIDITSLPDGIYWLRSIADPYHLFQVSETSKNATDTQVQITGNTVKVLQQIQPNSTPPTVTLISPVVGASVSGPVILTATATPVTGSSIQSVQFLVDGQPVSGTVTSNPPQYSITWNAKVAGSHLITAQATGSSGFIGTAPPVFVTVATQIGALLMDQTVNATGVGTVTTQAFSTSAPNEQLLAFVGSDGPVPSQSQSVTVSGGGLLWTLVQRGNAQSGDAEIWSATLASAVSNITVTSTPISSGYSQSLTVVALHGTGGIASIGAHSSAGAPHGAGAASVSLTTTAPGSWVLGVGSDYDKAIAPTLGANQQLINQQLFTAAGVTFWVQATTGMTPLSNTIVTLNDTAPTGDQWNFSSVEVIAAGAQPPPQDTTPPIVNIVTPSSGIVSGNVIVSANATDNVALSTSNPVVFYLNSSTLPGQVTSNGSLFSTSWNTTTSANGTQLLRATATDTSNNTSTTSVSVTVSNPPPTTTCFIVDATTNAQGRGPVTTSSFNDALPGELLVAFAASDGPSGSQTLTVSGAGLSWKLVKRANAQSGTAEIWTATAPSSANLTNATVTAKQSKAGYDMSLYLIAIQGTGGIGASAAASASSGAPTVTLKTTKAGSLVYGVGNDYDRAVGRIVGTNQIPDNQWLDSGTGDTYWVQNQTYPPLIPAGAFVTLNDTAPTNDRWNFVSIEIIADDN
jgi:Bacterial Ig domain